MALVLTFAGPLAKPAQAQSNEASAYVFTTFAGYAGVGDADGIGSDAQFFFPHSTTVDTNGNVFVADTYNNTIRRITPAGLVTTLTRVSSPGGAPNVALFYYPYGITADTAGNLYVAETGSHVIQKLTPSGTNWLMTTIAGSYGQAGTNDGTGAAARFNSPHGIIAESPTNLYVADATNHTIRKVSFVESNWVVTTVAGAAGVAGASDGTNSDARFNCPVGIAVETNGTVYVADRDNQLIRKIALAGSNWVVTTIAGSVTNSGSADGTGTNALFSGPTGVAASKGKIYVAEFNNHTIRAMALAGDTWTVTTFAGKVGYSGALNGTGTNALFFFPFGLSADGFGNLYIADKNNCAIRKISSAGLVRTVAGASASVGSMDGLGQAARLNQPHGVALDQSGNLFVADTDNHTIRAITPLGEVSTLAGLAGSPGAPDGVGTEARFRFPGGLSADSLGNLYVADTYNSRIRIISPAGEVRTLAAIDGMGNNVLFNLPASVAADNAGHLFVTDTSNHTIRKLSQAGTNWIATTIAGLAGQSGSGDGTNFDARFNFPNGITVDASGTVYIADTSNQTIRQIVPMGTNWIVRTIAGASGVQGTADGTNTHAEFTYPWSLTIDPAGNIYVSDHFNNTIRKLTPVGSNWVVTTVGGSPRGTGSSDGAGSAAFFSRPAGIAVDAGQNLYVADSANNTIRKGVFIGYVASKPVAYTPPPSDGALQVVLDPSESGGQWRFSWEVNWRDSGDTATNLARGNYAIQFRAVPNWLVVATNFVVAVTNGGITSVTNRYYHTEPSEDTELGSLTVNIFPSSPPGDGWRLIGEQSYRSPGSTATNLLPDIYFIEFKPVDGYSKPATMAIQISSGLAAVVSANYLLAQTPPSGVQLPVAIPPATIADLANYPFGFNGQLVADRRYGSGVAVLTNVVLTAAHLLFNDQTLSYARQAYWYFRQEQDYSTTAPLGARAFYILSGYASQRTNDLLSGLYGPDQSSPQSRNQDVAAIYFDSPVAGGGYGGYLPSDAQPNSWLTGTALKMVVGYPVDGSLFGTNIIPGRMYQTLPQPYPLSQAADPLANQQVYTANWFLTYPGASGGPLYVQFNGYYYPAAVYLGTLYNGTQPYASLVRAIDSAVVSMINLASTLRETGTNNTNPGVITVIPGQVSSAGPAYLQVLLGPPRAITAGAGWRKAGDMTPYHTNADLVIGITNPAQLYLEFETNVPGWNPPPAQTIGLVQSSITTVTGMYSVSPPLILYKPGTGLGLTGTIGTDYRFERRFSLLTGTWVPITTNSIRSNGFNPFLSAFSTNGGSAFFRAVWLP